jgi:hypothetical protein
MIKISATLTRPSVSVPWHFEVIDMSAVNNLAGIPPWMDKHQAKTPQEFVAPGAGQTSMTTDTVWASQADWEAFKATSEHQSYAAARDAYNAANGITLSAETITTV